MLSSIGDLESLQDTCDEDTSDVYYDRPCESCSEGGRNVEAISFCPTCDTFLCQMCLNVHSRLALSRNHHVLLGDDMPKSVREKPVKYLQCQRHVIQCEDKYCLNHEVMVCEKCREETHASCLVQTISDVCKTFDAAAIKQQTEIVSDACKRATTLRDDMQSELKRLDESQAHMLSEVKELYAKATEFILQLYKQSQNDIEEKFKESKRNVEAKIDSFSDFKHQLDIVSVDLDKLQTSSFNERSFIRLQEIILNIHNRQDAIRKKAVEKECKEVKFEISDELQKFLTNCPSFGDVILENCKMKMRSEDMTTVTAEKSAKKQGIDSLDFEDALTGEERKPPVTEPQGKESLSDMKAVASEPLNTSIKEDKLVCFITGIAVRENGDILVVDWNNNRVKMFSKDGKLLSFCDLSSLKLAYWPCEVCLVDDTTAVVCLTGTNRLHILKILGDNSIKFEKNIKLTDNKTIRSVTPYDLELVLTCGTPSRVIHVLKQNGDIDWSVDTNKKGEQLFGNINSIYTFGNHSRKVLVADKENESISLLHVDRGEILCSCTVKDKIPKKITADCNGHVYAHYNGTKEIVVWRENLTRSFSLVNDLKSEPMAIAFNSRNSELLVSYESCDTIDRIALQNM